MYLIPQDLLTMCREAECTTIVLEFRGGDDYHEEADVYMDVDNDELYMALHDWALSAFEGDFDFMFEYSYTYTYDLIEMEIKEEGVEGIPASRAWDEDEEFCLEAQ